MIAQKHSGNANFARGFCRYGSVCFEDEESSKIEAFSSAQICRTSVTPLMPPLAGRQLSSDAAKPQLLKVKTWLNPHRLLL
jgi:hypothetical protein